MIQRSVYMDVFRNKDWDKPPLSISSQELNLIRIFHLMCLLDTFLFRSGVYSEHLCPCKGGSINMAPYIFFLHFSVCVFFCAGGEEDVFEDDVQAEDEEEESGIFSFCYYYYYYYC